MAKSRPRSMRQAIDLYAGPALRGRGFSGELPHLRRITPQGTHLFTYTVSKYGGRFIIDLGRAAPGPYDAGSGRIVEPAELRAVDLHLRDRARLNAAPPGEREMWFDYAPSLADRAAAFVSGVVGRKRNASADAFVRAARALLALLPECDAWWANGKQSAYVRHFPPDGAKGRWFEIVRGGVHLIDAATRSAVARREATGTRIVQLFPMSTGVVVREDHYRHPADISNVYLLDDQLGEVWRAERPAATDVYVNPLTLLDGLLECSTWEGWTCHLDPATGRITSREFTK